MAVLSCFSSHGLSWFLLSFLGIFAVRFDTRDVVSFGNGAIAAFASVSPRPFRPSMRGARGGVDQGRESESNNQPEKDDAYKILRDAQATELSCRDAYQPYAVVDAGSTGTRVYLYAGSTRACPGEVREVVPESIRYLVQGRKASSLRSIFDEWLMKCLGEGWEESLLLRSFPSSSSPSSSSSASGTSSKKLADCVPFMRSYAANLVNALKKDMVALINQKLTFQQQIHSKQLGVPVFFHSTASIRDYQDWYVDGFFTLFRQELNAWNAGDPYHFFSTPDMTRPITGAEEGLFSFLSLNYVTGRLRPHALPSSRQQGQGDPSQQLASVIEVGGASAQIVSPLPQYPLLPPFIKRFSLAQDTGLTQWPRLEVLSVSFLQLGVASAGGLLLKNTCASPEFLVNGVCHNPCYPPGFVQAPCSAGRASISPNTGRVTVNDNPRESRLNTSAMYCSRFNSAISYKPLNELSCRANGLDPDLPLEERVAFPKCRQIVGTGDFEKCYKEVERVLLSPELPIPGNMEASGAGFDSVDQLFRLVPSMSPVHFIGDALVNALKALKDNGYIQSSSFVNDKGEVLNTRSNVEELARAAAAYCKSSFEFVEGKGLLLQTPQSTGGSGQGIQLDGFNITTCSDLAFLYGFLKHMQAAEIKPDRFVFKTKFLDETNPNHINNGMEFGWHLGSILYRVLRKESWAKTAYEAGIGFNLPAQRT